MQKQFSTLALGCALVASTALSLINCTDPAPPKFTVTFDTNGGIPAVKDKTLESGKLLDKPATEPTKTDSIFVGWYKDKALTQAFNFSSDKINANIILYAKWDIATYTVIFNSNGGTNVDQQTVESGKKASKPIDPTKEGNTFEGWYGDEALVTVFDFNAGTITQNTTLYAKWESYLVEIPDAKFRAKLKALIPVAFVGELLNTKSVKVAALTRLNINRSGIQSLAGIEYFTELTWLLCYGNQLTSLDLSKNTKLTWLNCGFNQLTDLDVSNNIVLTQLECFHNRLTRLDIRGMRSVMALKIHQDTDETNSIETLKVHESLKNHEMIKALKSARGSRVKVATYSTVDGSTAYILTCSNYIPALNGEKGFCIGEFNYTVTFNSNGGSLVSSMYLIREGTISKPTNPTKVGHVLIGWYDNPGFTREFQFDIDTISANTTLYAKWESRLVAIPDYWFRARLKLLLPESAFVGDSLSSISDHVTGQTYLYLAKANIKSLTGIEYFTGLTNLDCQSNNLTDLDVSKNAQLTRLRCNLNRLTTLDVSSNTALKELDCSENSLSSLDLSKNIQLTKLVCSSNQLTDLDFSNNRQLTGLGCNSNKLTNLNVSNNTALAKLYCYYNELTSLDLSNNTQLVTLWCFYNHLIDLDMRGMRSVTRFIAPSGLLIHHTPIPGLPNEETNVIKTLKVHENLKDHEQVKKVKTARGDEVKIATYSAADRSTAYTLLCSDYDPTAGSEADRCGDALKYTVAFNSNGGSLVDTLSLYHEGSISKPVNPTKADSLFVGWYKDAGLTQAFSFNSDKIADSTTLYARWTSNRLTTANKELLSRVDTSGKVTIMEGVLSVGKKAFYNSGLTAVTLPKSVTAIRSGAFQNNELTSVTFPDNVTFVGDSAFQNNELTAITLPNSVAAVGSDAFTANPDLETVTLSETLYNAIVQKTRVEVNVGGSDGIIFILHTEPDQTFGDQVRIYKTHNNKVLRRV